MTPKLEEPITKEELEDHIKKVRKESLFRLARISLLTFPAIFLSVEFFLSAVGVFVGMALTTSHNIIVIRIGRYMMFTCCVLMLVAIIHRCSTEPPEYWEDESTNTIYLHGG